MLYLHNIFLRFCYIIHTRQRLIKKIILDILLNYFIFLHLTHNHLCIIIYTSG